MLEDFDFAALDRPDFKEDAVREDIIAPILRKAGYRATGAQRMERSKSLVHPFVMIGSKRHPVNIIPDYTLFDDAAAIMVVEAKGPNEPIVRSEHVEQAFSYAIHQDVRCHHYALCNGREFVFYSVSLLQPLFRIDCKDILARWAEVEKYLLPRYLRTPELRDFHADFGLQAVKLGVSRNERIAFDGYSLQLLAKSADGLYTSQSTCNVGGLECLISFDLHDPLLTELLTKLPIAQSGQIRSALTRHPFVIDLDGKIRVSWSARLGELVKGPHEEFVPMLVTDIQSVELVPSATLGPQDPGAIAAGAPRLRV